MDARAYQVPAQFLNWFVCFVFLYTDEGCSIVAETFDSKTMHVGVGEHNTHNEYNQQHRPLQVLSETESYSRSIIYSIPFIA